MSVQEATTTTRAGLGLGRLRIGAIRDYGVVVATVALFVVLSFSSDAFLTSTNLLNLLEQQVTLGIVAAGATLVIIAGGFDLSIGAVFALSSVLAAKVATEVDPVAGIVAGILVGLACGIVNGAVATIGRINSFIATLASSIIVRGIALAVSGGFSIAIIDPGFRSIGNDELLGMRLSIWIMLAFVGVLWFVLARTTFGHYVYAAGGNAEAARLSGIRVNAVRAATFAICGLGAGIAGVLVTSRVGTAQADVGVGLELTAIAAIVVGGTSIAGGSGSMWRTVLGVTLLALIGNGFNLLNIDAMYRDIFTGALIMAAVAIDAWARRRTA